MRVSMCVFVCECVCTLADGQGGLQLRYAPQEAQSIRLGEIPTLVSLHGGKSTAPSEYLQAGKHRGRGGGYDLHRAVRMPQQLL